MIWGFDIVGGQARPLTPDDLSAEPAAGANRWLHLNLADQRSRRWLAEQDVIPVQIREALLGPDAHQRALIDGAFVFGAFHDVMREFQAGSATQMSTVRMAVGPGLTVTARQHPVRTADVIRRRIEAGARPASPAAALDLMITAILETAAGATAELTDLVQRAEDALLDHDQAPPPRVLAGARREAVMLNRQVGGLRALLQRLDEDEDLPDGIAQAVARLVQRSAAQAGDIQELQGSLRLLREELDLQQAQRTNQNLYLLSLLSALLLPATLVTGLFGMNTEGLPFVDSPAGGAAATALSAAAAFGVYLWLRLNGFFRR